MEVKCSIISMIIFYIRFPIKGLKVCQMNLRSRNMTKKCGYSQKKNYGAPLRCNSKSDDKKIEEKGNPIIFND